MTCRICNDSPYLDYECFCGCHDFDIEAIQLGLKRCDNIEL